MTSPSVAPPVPATGPFAALATPLVPTKTILLDAGVLAGHVPGGQAVGGPVPGDAVQGSGDAVAAKRAEIRRYFHQTAEIYDRLFALIRDDASYYERYEPLRHPLIFYFAHPAVFYVNKLIAGRYLPARIDPRLEAMMAVGVDEMSWDDLNTAHYDWPAVEVVRGYRAALRERIDAFIEEMPLELPIRQDAPAWIILMGIEHERIHLETSSVIMRRMPLGELRHGGELTAEERRLWASWGRSGTPPANDWLPVAAGTVRLGKPESDRTFGWDNEYGAAEVHVPPFRAGRRLVSNAEFLEFVADGGYSRERHWTEEGLGWLRFTQARQPRFWLAGAAAGGYRQRNLLEEIPLPLDWPVEVNCLEAEAYCAWLAEKTGTPVRLPTEAHWYALRRTLPAEVAADQPDWSRAPGNINLEHGASSCPVDAFPQGEFCDVIGNVWQWTRTPIAPFEGFAIHPLYDDFSVPTFDGRHNLIKGGSWISTGNEALASARYAFRRHFFQHAGFRTIVEQPGSEPLAGGTPLYETDQIVAQYLEFHYGPETLGVPNFPRACVAAALRHLPADRRGRCLDVGCAVGRSVFEFARVFTHVDAIDFSTRFIQSGVRLQESGAVLYEVPTEGELVLPRSVSLDGLGLAGCADRVSFLQGDACNLRPLFTDYDLVFAGNLIDRLYDPASFLREIPGRILPGGLLVLTSPYTWLEEHTPKEKWIGGRREHGEPLSSFAGLRRLLEPACEFVHREDIPFVIRETARKHQHTVAEMTVWRRT